VKVGFLQVDGKIPNLALMQICGYHESLGYEVEWYKGPLFAHEYEMVYASKIFSFSPTPELPSNSMIGGTGIDFFNTLPAEMADAKPSYTLYPKCNYHIGFTMKGCRLRCKFCCVPQKEGRPRFNSTITDLLTNPNGGNRLMLLDNDFFGTDKWRSSCETLIEMNLRVSFAQGLNIRIITDEQAAMLSRIRFQNTTFNHHYVTFAWDRYQDKQLVLNGIDRCVKSGIEPKQMQFFVLIGFDTTFEQDMERITLLRDRGCLVYVMPFNRADPQQAKLARWVNHRAIFNTVKWEDYK